ncbi:MAG: hypothetical protein ABI045_02195 [Flavobacteriales bacterium]
MTQLLWQKPLPPLVKTIDLKEAYRKNQMQGLFSLRLIAAI